MKPVFSSKYSSYGICGALGLLDHDEGSDMFVMYSAGRMEQSDRGKGNDLGGQGKVPDEHEWDTTIKYKGRWRMHDGGWRGTYKLFDPGLARRIESKSKTPTTLTAIQIILIRPAMTGPTDTFDPEPGTPITFFSETRPLLGAVLSQSLLS